ncbi:MAG TPA: PVC-type heme-binding CxxCH protein [Flavitalea sp.]|nr:PVC-type heme-binding CxxCH protein [Flavitalea sp.]
MNFSIRNAKHNFLAYSAVFLFMITACSCSNNKDEKRNSIQNELDGLKVPEGYTIEKIVDQKLISYPMFASFDGTGRLFVFESDGSTPSTQDMLKNPSYHVRLLEDTNEDGVFDKSTIFADSLTFPKGGVFYKGSLYVTASPDFLRLTDTDNDGNADKREVIQTGWVLDHNAAILGGPFMGPDGWMYLTDARRSFDITNKEGKEYKGQGARIWRCKPDGSSLEPIAGGGYDNAIELVFMPGGETIGTMTYFTDPQGGERDALMHWVEGGVYPRLHAVIEQDKLKMTGELMPVMKKIARVAPTGLMKYSGTALGDDFDGNLFSAEFNTGRIIRSTITADGATFKTSDQPFIIATIPDVHPTDVLQDADGSLILINTGGWFIAGCPLSRIAKLDVPGGIYRVKKNNAQKADDPWGKKIEYKRLSAEQLGKLVIDKRIFVSGNAQEQLVDLGDGAIAAVKNILLSSTDENIRAAGVFILGRIGSAKSLAVMLNAFTDTSAIVKTAAARMAGLTRDANATVVLRKLVVESNLAVRRQSAIALEQIADTGSIRALLEAASLTNDRYSEHSIIHAMIVLNQPQALVAALNDSSSGVRKASLIALDQMDAYKLQKADIVPFLESDSENLQQTGKWVASHHNDWGDVVVSFLLKGREDKNLMLTFSTNPLIQKYISDKLYNKSYPYEKKSVLFDVISASPIKKFPPEWIALFRNLLKTNDDRIKSQVLTVIQARAVKELNPQLQQIIFNNNVAPELILKAFAAKIASDPLLTAREFSVLLPFLGSPYQPPVRQQASRIISSAELSNAQLAILAKQIPSVENYILPAVIYAFEGNTDNKTGNTLVASLNASAQKLDNFDEEDLHKVLNAYHSEIKKAAEPLFTTIKQKNAARLSKLQQAESSLSHGDVGEGRKLFFGKATCSTCHAIVNQGSKFAPDLTNIGQIRSRHDILEAIMFPSASFAREHETNKVITKTNSYTGIIKEQYPDAIIIAQAPGATVRIPKNQIVSIEQETVSMMPPGLDKQLKEQELSNLIAYLASLPDGLGGTIGY